MPPLNMVLSFPSKRRTAMTPVAAEARELARLHDEAARESRERRIADAAYYRALHRGFEPGHELEDWCEAEREIDQQVADSYT